jgi:hypothetical protein
MTYPSKLHNLHQILRQCPMVVNGAEEPRCNNRMPAMFWDEPLPNVDLQCCMRDMISRLAGTPLGSQLDLVFGGNKLEFLIGILGNLQSVQIRQPGKSGYHGVAEENGRYKAQLWHEVLPPLNGGRSTPFRKT